MEIPAGFGKGPGDKPQVWHSEIVLKFKLGLKMFQKDEIRIFFSF